MALSHFEMLLEKALAQNVDAMFRSPVGDEPSRDHIAGVRNGLLRAGELYKQAMGLDLDPDGDGV